MLLLALDFYFADLMVKLYSPFMLWPSAPIVVHTTVYFPFFSLGAATSNDFSYHELFYNLKECPYVVHQAT